MTLDELQEALGKGKSTDKAREELYKAQAAKCYQDMQIAERMQALIERKHRTGLAAILGIAVAYLLVIAWVVSVFW